MYHISTIQLFIEIYSTFSSLDIRMDFRLSRLHPREMNHATMEHHLVQRTRTGELVRANTMYVITSTACLSSSDR